MKELNLRDHAVRGFIASATDFHEGDTTNYGDGTRVLQIVSKGLKSYARLWEPGDTDASGGSYHYEDYFLPKDGAS